MTGKILEAMVKLGLGGVLMALLLKIDNLVYVLAGALATLMEPDKLHPKHRLTKYHEWFVSRMKPGWRVLDIGCGNGALSSDMRKACAEVVGIDVNEKNIETAKRSFSSEGISYVCADALKWRAEGSFDAIVMSNVLEHIERRPEFLRSLYAQFDGSKGHSPLLLLRVPQFDRDWLVPYKREKGAEWRLDRTHFTEYTLPQLKGELSEAGFEMLEAEFRYGEIFCVARKA